MVFRSGRERRLVVSGRWQGVSRASYVCTRTFPSAPNRLVTLSEDFTEFVEVRALGTRVQQATVSTFDSWPSNPACSSIWVTSHDLTLSVTLWEGSVWEQTLSVPVSVEFAVSDGGGLDLDTGADFRIEADVEEWFEVTDPILDSDGQGFADYGGPAAVDGTRGRGVRYFERLKPEGTVFVTAKGLAEPVLALPVSQAQSDWLGDVGHEMDVRGQVRAKNASALLVVTGTVGGEAVRAEYSRSNGSGQFVGSEFYSLSLSKGVGAAGSAYGYWRASVPVAYEWSFRPMVGRDVLSEPVLVKLEEHPGLVRDVLAAGLESRLFDQRRWEGFASIDGQDFDPAGVDEGGRVRCWLDGGDLASRGDLAGDWRLVFRGREWEAFRVGHLEESVLDDGSSLVGWSGSGAGLSLAGGAVRVSVGGGAGVATRSFSPAVAMEGYRYLEVRFRSLSGGGRRVRVGLGGKWWDLESGAEGVWVKRRIDLCFPDSESLEVDEKESRYPLDGDGFVVDSAHWGVSRAWSVTFSELAAGEEFEVGLVALVRARSARLGALPVFGQWRLEREGSARQVKAGVWSEVDGRVSDLAGMERTGQLAGWRSLADLREGIAGLGGWVVSAGVGSGDLYHTTGREAEWALGGGLVRTGSVVGPGVDLDFRSETGVRALALWDEVEVYGGAGSVWDQSRYGGATRLDTGKGFRAQAWGLLAGASEAESSGAGRLLDAGGGVRGVGSTDGGGFFVTGLPGGLPGGVPGGVSGGEHRVAGQGVETGLFLVFGRGRHRRVLRELGAGGSLSLDWHPCGLTARGWLDSAGVAQVAVRGNGGGAGYVRFSTGFLASSVALRWDLGRRPRLWMVTEEGAGIRERFSDDLGETWSMATVLAIGNVRTPAMAVHADGRRFVYWLAEGRVDGVVRDASGLVLREVTGARTGVEEKGLAVAVSDKPGGRVVLEMATVEGGQVVASESTDGEVFS